MSEESEQATLERMKATMIRVAYIAMVIALALVGLWLVEQLQS